MLTISNGLSLCRAPLAFLFLYENPILRVCAVILAMITDSIDGYIARRTRTTSRLGAILDPLMDKFFVYFALIVLFLDERLVLWEVGALVSRDFALLGYGMISWITGRWKTVVFQSIRWGKVATTFQFVILIGLAAHLTFAWYIYVALFCIGGLAFQELMRLKDQHGIRT